MSIVQQLNFKDFISHAIRSIESVKEAIPFIREHKLWQGFLENKWVLLVVVTVSVLFSYFVLDNLFHIGHLEGVQNMGLASNVNMNEAMESAKGNAKQGAFSSGTKYMLLIMLEVVIFHFSVKTLNILSSQDRKPKFSEFFKAEKRMVKLLIISYFKGLGASIVLAIILGIIGLDSLTSLMMFFVYGYFIGYSLLDNYNEQYGISMKKSREMVRGHVGAATAMGAIISVLMYVPLIGPIFAPILGAIAASLYGHKYQLEKTEVSQTV